MVVVQNTGTFPIPASTFGIANLQRLNFGGSLDHGFGSRTSVANNSELVERVVLANSDLLTDHRGVGSEQSGSALLAEIRSRATDLFGEHVSFEDSSSATLSIGRLKTILIVRVPSVISGLSADSVYSKYSEFVAQVSDVLTPDVLDSIDVEIVFD